MTTVNITDPAVYAMIAGGLILAMMKNGWTASQIIEFLKTWRS